MAYQTIEVRKLTPVIGAEIGGVDLSKPLGNQQFQEVHDALMDNLVVFFRDQTMTIEQHKEFGRRFGKLHVHPNAPIEIPEHPEILVIKADEKSKHVAGEEWHSDVSCDVEPPMGSILHLTTVPPVGGDTLFADAYRAYESLSPTLRRILDGLRAIHSPRRSHGTKGDFAKESGKRAMNLVVGDQAEEMRAQPLVRLHPDSGRRALYVSPIYTIGIEGMEDEEAQPLLDFLFKRMLEDRFIYRHRWQPDMLTMWDNRCTIHYADGGYDGHRRLMHRTTVAGEIPTGVP